MEKKVRENDRGLLGKEVHVDEQHSMVYMGSVVRYMRAERRV